MLFLFLSVFLTSHTLKAQTLGGVDAEIAGSDAYIEMAAAKEDLASRMETAIRSGLDVIQLKAHFLSGNHDDIYKMLGMNNKEIQDLEERYFTALDQLKQEFPNTLSNPDPNNCPEVSGAHFDLFISSSIPVLLADDPSIGGNREAQGCSAGAYICAAHCGLFSPTVIGALLCGAVCVCGFCDQAPC